MPWLSHLDSCGCDSHGIGGDLLGTGDARAIIVATNNSESAREKVSKVFEIYGTLPSYRAMLDKEGAAGPADIALIGDETELRQKLNTLREIGVTDFNAVPIEVEKGTYQRTVDFLASELWKRVVKKRYKKELKSQIQAWVDNSLAIANSLLFIVDWGKWGY